MSSPWKRKRPLIRKRDRVIFRNTSREPFDLNRDANIDLDLDTKLSALRVSPSVVSLKSTIGFICSGTIIDCKEESGAFISTILTSASLLRPPSGDHKSNVRVSVYLLGGKSFVGEISVSNFHYNIATIKITSDAPLPTATLRRVDDTVSIASELNSTLFHLSPGVQLIAVGRQYATFNLMVAPGVQSRYSCNFDCEELCRSSCKISISGIGGPLINCYGEVVGINFHHELYTPFLPINIVSKCLEQLKTHGRVKQPWLGMEMSTFYSASANKLEKIVRKFCNIKKGVIIKKVRSGSPAHSSGLHPNDVIIHCDQKLVGSTFELFEIMLDKAGKSVDVIVMRTNTGEQLNLTLEVSETPKCNRWPVSQRRWFHVKGLRK